MENSLDKHLKIQVKITPQIESKIKIDQQRKHIEIIPTKKLLPDQEYSFGVKVIYRDNPKFIKQLYQGNFHTKVPPQVIYNLDKEGKATKTETITWEIKPNILSGKCFI